MTQIKMTNETQRQEMLSNNLHERQWLSVTETRTRINDLLKAAKISQAELAPKIGIDRSAFSRFISGKTDMIAHETVIKIARYFNVSTDFVLGETDDPSRINYDIGELGLTVKAAECLYTGKVNTDILCRLIEHEKCGELLDAINKAINKTWVSGIVAQNTMYDSVSNLLYGLESDSPEDRQRIATARSDVEALKMPLIDKDAKIAEQHFDSIVSDMANDEKPMQSEKLTKSIFSKMFTFRNKKKGARPFASATVTVERIMEAVDKTLSNVDMSNEPEDLKIKSEAALTNIREGFKEFMSVLREKVERAA